jgi:hypothetical protein
MSSGKRPALGPFAASGDDESRRDAVLGTVWLNAWNEGSAGGSTTGATFERATGLTPSRNNFHSSSTATYPRLNSANPSNEKGRGERSSHAQNAVRGRPRAARYASICRKPSARATGRAKRTRSIANPGSATTPCEYGKTPLRNAKPPSENSIRVLMPRL